MGESNAVRTRQPLMRKAVSQRAAAIYAERFEEKETGTLPVTFQASSLCQLFTPSLVAIYYFFQHVVGCSLLVPWVQSP